jgi:hypothetical protein
MFFPILITNIRIKIVLLSRNNAPNKTEKNQNRKTEFPKKVEIKKYNIL